MGKHKGPRRPAPLKAVLQELESALAECEAQYKADFARKTQTDTFISGRHAGYKYGIEQAIRIVNLEIGIRQNPPNVNYPGERPE
jgi:hypothetical protein